MTTSKTKEFCETSFKKGKLSAELTASYQCVLRFFHSTCLKYCACHEKVRPGHTKCCTCTQNHLPKTEDLMLQNATCLRKSAPGPPNISDEHVFCSAPATENASLQIFFKCPTPAIVFGNATKPSRFAHFWEGAQSLAPATRNDIWTSKSNPNPLCFVHSDLEMCFAPQRRALFRHLNFQKWSENGVFCTFWLGNVLRATTACTFSTSQLPKVVREWCVLYILTWKCASRHNGMHFSTSQLPKVVRTWCVLYILTSKCASRHNGVHFFDVSTSKSGPELVCFVHFDFEMCFVPQRRALFRHLNFQKWSETLVFCTFWLRNVLRATTACTFSTQLPKVVRTPGVLYFLTSKCASRHNGVHFFDISTSKSGPNPWCFVHFDFEMCFVPQWCALFRHLNFQKWSEPLVFCTFWLRNVLRATMACIFPHRNFQKCSNPLVLCTFWLGNVFRATTACNFSSLIWADGSAPAALASLLFDPPVPPFSRTWWYSDGILRIFRFYSGYIQRISSEYIQMVFWWHSEDILMIFRSYPDDVQIFFWWYSDDFLILFWSCLDDIQMMFWWYSHGLWYDIHMIFKIIFRWY